MLLVTLSNCMLLLLLLLQSLAASNSFFLREYGNVTQGEHKSSRISRIVQQIQTSRDEWAKKFFEIYMGNQTVFEAWVTLVDFLLLINHENTV